MIRSVIPVAAFALALGTGPVIAQTPAPSAAQSPAPDASVLPEIGRVRSTAPACAAMRDLIIPSFAAARRADLRFEQTRVRLPQYAGFVADPEHNYDIFRTSTLAKLESDASVILNETLAINKALGDPRLKDTTDPAIAAEKAQLQQLYNTQQARANALQEFVMRERNTVARVGMQDSGALRGKRGEAAPLGANTLPPQTPPPEHPAPIPALTAAPGMPILNGNVPQSDKAAVNAWSAAMTNAVRFSENQAAKTFLTIADVCR